MPRTRFSSPKSNRTYGGEHRPEHWYRDNQVYFITARCTDRFPAFAGEEAKAVFWQQFDRYTKQFGFTPWITSLLDNHYHTLGYLRLGRNLGTMMQRMHGSCAKLVNDQLDERLKPFWGRQKDGGYFDGCLRDEIQANRTYRYIERQAFRHGITARDEPYPHTRVVVRMQPAVERATDLKAFLYEVPYRRYQAHGG